MSVTDIEMGKHNKPDPFGYILILMLCLIAWQVLSMFGCNSASPRPDLVRARKEYQRDMLAHRQAIRMGGISAGRHGIGSQRFIKAMQYANATREIVANDLKRINLLKPLK